MTCIVYSILDGLLDTTQHVTHYPFKKLLTCSFTKLKTNLNKLFY